MERYVKDKHKNLLPLFSRMDNGYRLYVYITFVLYNKCPTPGEGGGGGGIVTFDP